MKSNFTKLAIRLMVIVSIFSSFATTSTNDGKASPTFVGIWQTRYEQGRHGRYLTQGDGKTPIDIKMTIKLDAAFDSLDATYESVGMGGDGTIYGRQINTPTGKVWKGRYWVDPSLYERSPRGGWGYIEFTIASDGKSFKGRYKSAAGGDWFIWDGRKTCDGSKCTSPVVGSKFPPRKGFQQ